MQHAASPSTRFEGSDEGVKLILHKQQRRERRRALATLVADDMESLPRLAHTRPVQSIEPDHDDKLSGKESQKGLESPPLLRRSTRKPTQVRVSGSDPADSPLYRNQLDLEDGFASGWEYIPPCHQFQKFKIDLA